MLPSSTVTGAGPVVTLVHSTAADGRQWDAQRDALAADWTVVVPDLHGYGQSPVPLEPFSQAHDVLALLDHLGVERTALVGSSGGGHVALQVASAAPERVSCLVLLCSAIGPESGVEPTDDLQAFARREHELLRRGEVEGAVELNVATWLGPDADDGARERLRTMQRRAFELQLSADEVEEEDLPVDLDRIDAPATVVTGRHDLDYFAHVGRHLVAGLPDALALELAWAGHLPNLERPDETTRLLERALLRRR